MLRFPPGRVGVAVCSGASDVLQLEPEASQMPCLTSAHKEAWRGCPVAVQTRPSAVCPTAPLGCLRPPPSCFPTPHSLIPVLPRHQLSNSTPHYLLGGLLLYTTWMQTQWCGGSMTFVSFYSLVCPGTWNRTWHIASDQYTHF